MTKTGKMMRVLVTGAAAVLAAMALTACGKSEFTMTENTEKRMVISATNADEGDFFMVGSLEAEEGDWIAMTSDLSKGEIKVEIIKAEEEQSIDKLPELDGEAVLTGNMDGKGEVRGTVTAGSYMLKATCVKKATGTVTIEVKEADAFPKAGEAQKGN